MGHTSNRGMFLRCIGWECGVKESFVSIGPRGGYNSGEDVFGGKCMTLHLTLPPELEDRLRKEAERQGLSADTVTLNLLNEHLPALDRRDELIALLQSWNEEAED